MTVTMVFTSGWCWCWWMLIPPRSRTRVSYLSPRDKKWSSPQMSLYILLVSAKCRTCIRLYYSTRTPYWLIFSRQFLYITVCLKWGIQVPPLNGLEKLEKIILWFRVFPSQFSDKTQKKTLPSIILESYSYDNPSFWGVAYIYVYIYILNCNNPNNNI